MQLAAAAIEPIPLSRVDWDDRRFAIESFRPIDDIRASIARVGLLSLPWVLPTAGERYAIVDGFKRMDCLRERGEERVMCTVFPADASVRDLWSRRLEARLFGPALNTAEKAQVAAILSRVLFEGEWLTRLLDGFDLPHRPEILGKWVRLSQADRSLLEAAALETIHERAALELARWPEAREERDELLSILEHLRCSASIQVEILERFRDISMMRGMPVGEVLRCSEVRAILGHPQWNHREKTQALRLWFDEVRLPRLKARERSFSEQLHRTPPPAGAQLVPPASFEGDRWRMEVVFSSGDELRECLGQLRSWSLSGGFNALLAPEPAWSSRPDSD
ncbi:MAG: ParB N-terminal domain-containing protein [Syntrophobacteraceae bacterium]|nr:ParB N-terminal domain-containing protein [Syntrophobacteraceae bacterium]